ncbi:MAG: DMT family transporter [Rikenellaceae bacterium]
MWVLYAFLSAALLGLYDVAKKRAVTNNAVLPVLLLTTFTSAVIFAPLLLSVEMGWFGDSSMLLKEGTTRGWAYMAVFLKAIIVLSSWVCGFFAIKHLPLTIVGPINAMRPMVVLIGAMTIFGERLNIWQWGGILLSLVSLYLLSRAGSKEGINFKRNRWIFLLAGAVITGAMSGLYDKYIMQHLGVIFVQGYYNLFQLIMMGIVVTSIWYPQRKNSTQFHWSWAIPIVSLMLILADLAYFYALEQEEAMISIISMIRRSSVIVSFVCGAIIFGERNLKTKAIDLLLILIGMILIYIGTV